MQRGEPPPQGLPQQPPPRANAEPANIQPAGIVVIGDQDEQQNVVDRNLVHVNVIEMFPDLDLTETIAEFGHMTPEGLASLIIDRMAQIPKKRGTKRKASVPEIQYRPGSAHTDSDISTENSDDLGDLLVDKFFAALIKKIKIELRQLEKEEKGHPFSKIKRNFLMNKFGGARADFIDKMLPLFDQAMVPVSIACFFAENGYANKLQKLAPGLSQNFWLRSGIPMQIKRKQLNQYAPPDIEAEFERYTQLMQKYKEGEYAALLTADLKLSQQHSQIRCQPTEPEEKIECLVCFEKFPLRRMTYCTAPTVPQHAFFASQSSMTEMNEAEAQQHIKADKPGTSNLLADICDTTTNEGDTTIGSRDNRHEWSIIDVGDEANTDPSTHPFCRDCIRGQAQAATEQQPLAEGGVGLCCMMPDCKNPILYSDIRSLLSREICKKLDERIMQENVGMALLSNLQRCKRCNYAVEMEVDKSVNKVFHCLQCDAKFCRICENDWDDDHFGVSCEELEQKLKRDKKDRDLEKQLNEAVIRKCPRCGVAFMKDQGCNKMTCRCGMTSCYICRADNIDYTHFCQHIRDPSNPNWKCRDCTKTCLLYEDAKKKDEELIAQIRKQAAEEVQPTTLLADQPTTSNANVTPPNAQQYRQPHGINRLPNDPRRGGRLYNPQNRLPIPNQANAQNPFFYDAPHLINVTRRLPFEMPYEPAYEQNLMGLRQMLNNNMPPAAHHPNHLERPAINAAIAIGAAAAHLDPRLHRHHFFPQQNYNQPRPATPQPPPRQQPIGLGNIYQQQQMIHQPPPFPPAALPQNNNNNNNNGNREIGVFVAQLREYYEAIPRRNEAPMPHQPLMAPLPPPPFQQQDIGDQQQMAEIPPPPAPNNHQPAFPQPQQPPIDYNAALQHEIELFDEHLNRFQILAEAAALNEAQQQADVAAVQILPPDNHVAPVMNAWYYNDGNNNGNDAIGGAGEPQQPPMEHQNRGEE